MTGLLVREARHLRHQLRPFWIGAHHRERGLRRLALAVQVIGEEGIEIAECDLDPALIGPAGRQRGQGYVAGIHLFAARTEAVTLALDWVRVKLC